MRKDRRFHVHLSLVDKGIPRVTYGLDLTEFINVTGTGDTAWIRLFSHRIDAMSAMIVGNDDAGHSF